MTAPNPPEATTAVPKQTVRKALVGYRVLAWATGLWLIALCYEMVLKYIIKVDDPKVNYESKWATLTFEIK